MKFQKRYVYSGILSGVFFTVCYVIIDIGILWSLLIAAFTFAAGILIFKEKDVISYDPNRIMDYYYKTSKILNYSNYIDDKKINDYIKLISKTSEQILRILEQKPKKATQVYNFYDYYMDLTLKILNKYIQVRNTDKEYVSKVDDYLKHISQSFEKQLNNMNQSKQLDVDKEIKVFEKIVNIDENDIKGSE